MADSRKHILLLNACILILYIGNSGAVSVNQQEPKKAELPGIVRRQQDRIGGLEKVVLELLAAQKDAENIKEESIKKLKISSLDDSTKILGAKGCLDLWNAGFILPGYYPVASDNRMRFVYCNKDTLAEVPLGYVDVKTSPVYFYSNHPGEFLNNNNAVIIDYPNIITYHPSLDSRGRFTAPINGIYQFNFWSYSFTRSVAGADTSEKTRVTLIKNSGIELSWNYADSDYPVAATMALSAIVDLNAGEWIEVRFEYGNIHECHFSGYLLEGDIPLD